MVSRRIVEGLLTPCNLKYNPHALHTISPRTFRRQIVVVRVPQFVQLMSLLMLLLPPEGELIPPWLLFIEEFGEAALEFDPPPFVSEEPGRFFVAKHIRSASV